MYKVGTSLPNAMQYHYKQESVIVSWQCQSKQIN